MVFWAKSGIDGPNQSIIVVCNTGTTDDKTMSSHIFKVPLLFKKYLNFIFYDTGANI